MKIAPYIEKLEKSKEYKDFLKKYSDAYLVAGFFILDLESKKNVHQIDFFIPSKKKIAAFSLDREVKLDILNAMNNQSPPKLDLKTNVDLDAIHGILEDEMKNRGITEEIKKIVAIIQNIDGKKVWNLNCVLSGMGILKSHVDDSSQTVLKMEKSSLFDYIQKSPMLQKLQQAQEAQQTANEKGSPLKVLPQNVNPKDELDKLNKLEEAIEKQKQAIQKEMVKSKPAKKESLAKTTKKK